MSAPAVSPPGSDDPRASGRQPSSPATAPHSEASALPPNWLTSALTELCTWPARPEPQHLASLPSGPAIYLLLDCHRRAVQLGTTQSLRRLICRLAQQRVPRRRKADLGQIVRGVRWRPLSTAFEGHWWYYRLARQMYPREYRDLIGFGPAYFLHVDWDQPIPEHRVTERVWCLPGSFIGPWPTRKSCQEALEGLQDLFDLCRHPEQLRRAPRGTPCAYAEMGRCDAPCAGRVTLEAYLARCRAAWRFAAGGVQQWVADARQRMEQAAAAQEYERAGQIKRQLEFAHRWQKQWAPQVRVAHELNYLLALPVPSRRAFKLILFRVGELVDGPVVPQRRLASDTPGWLSAQLARPPQTLLPTVRMEQTWLVCQLLSRQCEAAAILPLPMLEVPSNLGELLSEHAAATARPRQRARNRMKIADRCDGADPATE